MKTKKYISVFILSVSFNTIFAQQTYNYSLDIFPKQITLTGEKVQTEPLTDPMNIYLIDNYLFIQNASGDYNYDIFDPSTGRRLKEFGRYGRGPDEFIASWSLQYLKKEQQIYIYDVITRKITVLSSSALINNEDNAHVRYINIDPKVYVLTPVLVNKDYFFCTLLGDRDRHMFCKLNSNGELISKIGSFPDLKKNYPTTVASNVFTAYIVTNLLKNKIILAYDNWDRIEIYNKEFNKLVTINGPEFKLPDISIDGETIGFTSDNPRCYQSPNAGDDYFMVLYSGKGVDDPVIYQKALCFDYEGKPFAIYKLNPPVYCITVDWKEHIIYGINNEMEPYLCKFRF